jgi:methionyl-tRNA formyltransferase
MSTPSVILLGSKPAAAVALSILLERRWDIEAVVVASNVDLSFYGGEPVDALAARRGIPVFGQAELPRVEVDFVISYQFRNLVKPDVLALARRAALNFHAAPLPEYGGWAFYNMAILERLSLYGCSCHHMDESFDTGPLLCVRRFPVDIANETALSLEARSQEEMLRLFVDVCHLAESGGGLPSTPQPKDGMRYLNRRQMEELKRIPAGADPETIDRHARAFWYPPFEGAYVEHGGSRVEVVPAIARRQLGRTLHQDDLPRLRAAVEGHEPRPIP